MASCCFFALAEWLTEKYVADRSRVASTAIVLVGTLVFWPIHEGVETAVEEENQQAASRGAAIWHIGGLQHGYCYQ